MPVFAYLLTKVLNKCARGFVNPRKDVFLSRNLVQISLTLSEDGGRPAAVLLADDGPGAWRRRGRPPARELLVPPGLAVQLFHLNLQMDTLQFYDR